MSEKFVQQQPNLDHYSTEKLIEMSIGKWMGVLAGAKEWSLQDCPLCSRFNSTEERSDNDCLSCPIFFYTGEIYCTKTPYDSYTKCSKENKDKYARAEIRFLKKVLRYWRGCDGKPAKD